MRLARMVLFMSTALISLQHGLAYLAAEDMITGLGSMLSFGLCSVLAFEGVSRDRQ